MLAEEIKQQLKERLKEINRKLNSLPNRVSTVETLVNEKRIIEKQLKQK